MIGSTSTVCAMTIAGGVNEQVQAPQRPGARQQEIDEQAHHDRRQPHQRVQDHDHRLASGKPPTAMAAPSGMPSSVAMATADRLTARLSPTMCQAGVGKDAVQHCSYVFDCIRLKVVPHSTRALPRS